MKNDTTPAMKKDNENSNLQKIGVHFQTENLNLVPASGM
jgi:hypothetical protein